MTNRSADIEASGVTSIVSEGRYRPYPAYKDSGVEWLGEIPAHWEMKQLRWVIMFQRGHDLPSDSREEGKVPVVSSAGISSTHSEAIAKAPGIVTGRTGTIGQFHLINKDYWPHNTALYSIDLHGNRPRFLQYMLTHMAPQFLMYAVKSVVPCVDRNDVHAERTAVPPLPEQRAIAAFLDRETAKIDALVAKKERLIELLQQKRTALIGDAVTKGLDPDVPLKDSGVEWLGEIPAHWEVKRLKSFATVQPSNVDKKSAEGQDAVRLSNYVDVYYNERIDDGIDFMPATATTEQIRRFSLRTGDVLITKDSETWTDIAVPAVVLEDLPGVLCGYHLAHIRPDRHCDGRFLSRAFAAVGPRDQYHIAANGITRFGLTGDSIRDGVFALPPLPEQRAIAAFLDRETFQIDALVAKVQEAIDRLKELRTALISAAVTGKIDVREAAA